MHNFGLDMNVSATLFRRAERDPERIALVFEEQEYSFAQFAERVRLHAGLLRDRGVRCGDRVAYLGFNHSTMLQTFFSALSLGAIFVPLNFRLTASELKYIINDAGVHSLHADKELMPVIEPVLDELCCRQYFSIDGAGNDRWCELEPACASAQAIDESVPVQPADVAIIMYTSGTTGLPKGAMLTHGNITWNNVNAMIAIGSSREDVVLTAAPLFHIGGLNIMTLHAFALGAKVVLMRAFDPEAVLENFQRYQVTHMFGAPAMFLFVSQSPNFADANLDSLSSLICGAAPVPESLMKLYGTRGVQFCQGYGLTETSPFSAFLTPDYSSQKLGSAGKAPLYSDIRIVSPENTELGAGERGEICLRGPNIMKGYWNRPEATAAAIDAEGWFHSGDIGYLDEDGFLFICDRLKDMVISGGENVYPAEVEEVLYKHEAIAEVAVIGLADEKWGEAVTAVAVLKEGCELSLEELRSFAEQHLAKYKLPLRLHIIDELPRNPAGKVLKFALREQLQ